MSKKVVYGIIGLFAVLAIAAAIMRPMLLWWVFWWALIVAWACLVWAVRKRKTSIFHEEMDPELAAKRLKWLKRFLWVGGVALALFIVGVIVHNAVFAFFEVEEAIAFTVGILGGLLLFVANIGSLVIFLAGRRKQVTEIPE